MKLIWDQSFAHSGVACPFAVDAAPNCLSCTGYLLSDCCYQGFFFQFLLIWQLYNTNTMQYITYINNYVTIKVFGEIIKKS